jgi:hypothetical protein
MAAFAKSLEEVAMDTLERFPRVWCDTCEAIQPMVFDVMKANDKNDHDSADIVCDECKSIIATLHAPSGQQASVRPKRAAKAREMAGPSSGSFERPISNRRRTANPQAKASQGAERVSRYSRQEGQAETLTAEDNHRDRLHWLRERCGLVVMRGGAG